MMYIFFIIIKNLIQDAYRWHKKKQNKKTQVTLTQITSCANVLNLN